MEQKETGYRRRSGAYLSPGNFLWRNCEGLRRKSGCADHSCAGGPGRLRELHKHANRDCTLSFITTKDNIGYSAYKRSALCLCLKAIYDIYGKNNADKVVIHYSLGNSYYFTLVGSTVVNEEFIERCAQKCAVLWRQKSPLQNAASIPTTPLPCFTSITCMTREKLFCYRRVSKGEYLQY